MDVQPASTASFPVGLGARVELTVTDADTAQAVGSGDVPVLGTPRLLALAEAATVAATATRIASGMTTVGVRAEVEHRLATPVGHTVVAQANLTKVDGRRLLFEVSVTDAGQVVAEAWIERVLVERQGFLARAFGDDGAAGTAGAATVSGRATVPTGGGAAVPTGGGAAPAAGRVHPQPNTARPVPAQPAAGSPGGHGGPAGPDQR